MNRLQESDLNNILAHSEKNLKSEFPMGSRIFISGATGFFGKWLLESLLFLNKELHLQLTIGALSRDPDRFLGQYPFLKKEKNIKWFKGDIKSFEFPNEAYNYIIHAATDADASLNASNPLLMLETIIEGTKRILEFSKEQPELKAILLTSSGAIYGIQPERVFSIKETDSFPLDINNPINAYAEGKRISELYCSIYAKQFNLPVKIVRCFAFVGPYLPLDKHYAIGNFIRDGLNGENIIIQGDGSPLRSYMYSSDLVNWILTILLKGDIHEVYNVGSNRALTIKELANKIAVFFPHTQVKILNQLRVTDRNHNYIPDTTKAKNRFNLDEEISLDDAIYKTIHFYKKL